MGEGEHALLKAIESRDADLIYLAIYFSQQCMKFQDFAALINKHPQAKSLFIALCRRHDLEMLKSFLYSVGDIANSAEVLVREAMHARGSDMKNKAGKTFTKRAQILEQVAAMYGRGKDIFHAKTLDEVAKLTNIQVRRYDLHERLVEYRTLAYCSFHLYVAGRVVIVWYSGNHRSECKRNYSHACKYGEQTCTSNAVPNQNVRAAFFLGEGNCIS